MTMKYNGHRSWNAWNVSLWINNEEPAYRWAVELVKRHGRRRAARIMAGELIGQRTPDGDRYNQTCIYEALEGITE
jgi:hypothetical protein